MEIYYNEADLKFFFGDTGAYDVVNNCLLEEGSYSYPVLVDCVGERPARLIPNNSTAGSYYVDKIYRVYTAQDIAVIKAFVGLVG